MTDLRRGAVATDPPRDLGFGTSLGQAGQPRLLRRDGTFAAARVGLAPIETFGLYHYLLTCSWPRFVALVGLAYFVANAAFATLYTSLGPAALKGGVATSIGGRFLENFFFSVHTLATIGYGNIVPVSLAANLVDTLESLVGLLGVSIIAGVVFARVSRPIAGIRFSDTALVGPYRGGKGLMFRLANIRRNELIRVQVEVSLSLVAPDGTRTFHTLELERRDVVFMPTSWTVVHPIGDSSPLAALDGDTIGPARPELFVLVTATEEVFSQVVHARWSYAGHEIAWGARFASMRADDDGFAVDLSRLSKTEPAAVA